MASLDDDVVYRHEGVATYTRGLLEDMADFTMEARRSARRERACWWACASVASDVEQRDPTEFGYFTLWTFRGRQGDPIEFSGTGRGPRSRRAAGVGDVAGERGGRAALIEAYNRRDLRAWLATFRSDAEIDWSRAEGRKRVSIAVMTGTRLSGRCGRHLIGARLRRTASRRQVPRSWSRTPPRFAGGRGSRWREERVLFTVENGQITRLRLFQEEAEALEAAGLSE